MQDFQEKQIMSAFFWGVIGELEPMPSDSGQEAGKTLYWLPVKHRSHTTSHVVLNNESRSVRHCNVAGCNFEIAKAEDFISRVHFLSEVTSISWPVDPVENKMCRSSSPASETQRRNSKKCNAGNLSVMNLAVFDFIFRIVLEAKKKKSCGQQMATGSGFGHLWCIIHPFSVLLTMFRVVGELEPLPADHAQAAGYKLDCSSANLQGTIIHAHTYGQFVVFKEPTT